LTEAAAAAAALQTTEAAAAALPTTAGEKEMLGHSLSILGRSGSNTCSREPKCVVRERGRERGRSLACSKLQNVLAVLSGSDSTIVFLQSCFQYELALLAPKAQLAPS
jgi:hypothetical protein